MVAECKILAKKQYRLCQHDRVGEIVYWVMCKRHGFSHAVKWYEHTLENVLENDNVKILWDFSVQTNQKLEHSKPNILIVDKQTGESHIIDVTCPLHTRVEEMGQEKVEQYHKLKRKIGRHWQCAKMVVIPIVTGALGTTGKGFRTWIRKIQMENYCELMQNVCLLGTPKIMRKVLDTSSYVLQLGIPRYSYHLNKINMMR